MENSLMIRSRIWICSEKGTFLGEGRVRLLCEIEKTGSIAKAARRMNMSYKKAWELVNSINDHCECPVVERSAGGINGGGSRLTEKGKALIVLFREINDSCQEYLEKKLNKINI